MGNTCKGPARRNKGDSCTPPKRKGAKGRTYSPEVGEPDEIVPVEGVTRVLACALDYKGYDATKDVGLGELSCTPDAARFTALARACGVEEVTFLTDNSELASDGWPGLDNVRSKLVEMGRKSQPGDCFVFFYAGHGTETDDWDGDEKDGQDEELCLTYPDGTYCPLVDDEIADILMNEFDPEVYIVFVTDCCQSGTVVDLDSRGFGERKICHFAAVKDYQYAQDLGDGGAFTSSLMETLENMSGEGMEEASCADVYSFCYGTYSDRFSDQDFSFSCSNAAVPKECQWPLMPPPGFEIATALD